MKDLTLVVMAAGLGSRFGGLKQITPVGPSGEFIIDYSIYDAVKCGFNKIVFIIKEENLEDFKNTIGNRVSKHVDVKYVFQKIDNIPEGCYVDKNREKPLGTGHAIYCVKDVVKECFAVITADDFYGREAFRDAAEFLQNNDINSTDYGMVAYPIGSVINENTSVKRGICNVKNGKLYSIVESSVEKKDSEIIATSLKDGKAVSISSSTPASMSLFLFNPTIFKYIESCLKYFLNGDDVSNREFFLPDVVDDIINSKVGSVSVINTNSSWYGVTYKEDLDILKTAILKLIDENKYNSNLWG